MKKKSKKTGKQAKQKPQIEIPMPNEWRPWVVLFPPVVPYWN